MSDKKYCVTCRWNTRARMVGIPYNACSNEVNISPIDGWPEKSPGEMRRHGPCGRLGHYWEQRTPEQLAADKPWYVRLYTRWKDAQSRPTGRTGP